MKYLVLILMLPLAGCTLFKGGACDAAKSIAGSVATGVAQQLDCKNEAAIQAFLMTQLDKTKVCESAATIKSPIGDFVCAPVVDAVVGAVQSQVPADWQCSGGAGKALVRAKLLELCTSHL